MTDRPLDLRPRLEAAIRESPDDPAAYAALGDLLAEAGDPRGAFVAVQLALEDPALAPEARATLAGREAELLREHEREWLGLLAEYLLDRRDFEDAADDHLQRGSGYCHRWRRGLLESIQVPTASLRATRCLARAPAAAFLRELVVLGTACWDGYEWDEEPLPGEDDPPADVARERSDLWPLLGAAFLATLRVAQFGPQSEGDSPEAWRFISSRISGDYVADLAERLSAVEELRILAPADLGRVFAAPLPRLRLLQAYHGDPYPLERLVANPTLGRLESLLFHPRANRPWEVPARLNLAGLWALGRSPHLGNLSHLRYRLTDAGDEGCRAIVETGLLGRLRSLDLRHGRVTDAGLDTLMASPDFGKLQWLDLTCNRLTGAGVDRLRASGVSHQATYQEPGAAADDVDYLFAGDWE